MEYSRKSRTEHEVKATPRIQPLAAAERLSPEQAQRISAQRQLRRFTQTPVAVQRQAVAPVWQAAQVQQLARASAAQQAALPLATPEALQAALQRQAERRAPVAPQRPQSRGDWVTVMRAKAVEVAGVRLNPTQVSDLTALQRQVSHTLAQGFKQDRQTPVERYSEYGEYLATLQRHPISRSVAQATLNLIPRGERVALQRATDQAVQRDLAQEQQDQQLLHQQALRHQGPQDLLKQIQAQLGSGQRLPEDIQRLLEQKFNHSLAGLRIHDGPEAALAAAQLGAKAFTMGQHLVFGQGAYNPRTPEGLELIAHESYHFVQQSQGRVGKGIDPDADLEQEAQEMGKKIAQQVSKANQPLIPSLEPSPYAPGVYQTGAALQRAAKGAVQHFSLKPLYDLQPGGFAKASQFGATELSAQRWPDWADRAVSWAGDKVQQGAAWLAEKGKEIIGSGLKVLPGYKQLCMAFGKDLVTGERMDSEPGAIFKALTDWAPGPLKDIIKALEESKAIPKAWAWFKTELGKLDLPGVLSEIGAAIGQADLGKATQAVTRRLSGLKNLILGSAYKIAEIGLTALAAGLGPIGQQIIAELKKGREVALTVMKDPIKFAKNLLSSLKTGFMQFTGNVGTHLKKGLGTWLTGSTGLTFPDKLDLPGVMLLALSVMGLTYQMFRGRLVKSLGSSGEKTVSMAEKTVDVVQNLKGGLHKSEDMKANQGNVAGDVVKGVTTEVTQSVVQTGVTKLTAMLIPGGGFIMALVGAFQAVQTIIAQGQQIMAVIASMIGSVNAIAMGNITGAANLVERTFAGSIPVALGFLARFLGLGNIANKVKNIIKKVQAKVNGVVDKMIDKLKKLFVKLFGKDKKAETPADVAKRNKELPDEEKKKKLADAVKAINPLAEKELKRGISASKFDKLLGDWQKKYDLTSLKRNSARNIVAAVNPDDELRVKYRRVGEIIKPISAKIMRAKLEEFKLDHEEYGKIKKDFEDLTPHAISGLSDIGKIAVVRDGAPQIREQHPESGPMGVLYKGIEPGVDARVKGGSNILVQHLGTYDKLLIALNNKLNKMGIANKKSQIEILLSSHLLDEDFDNALLQFEDTFTAGMMRPSKERMSDLRILLTNMRRIRTLETIESQRDDSYYPSRVVSSALVQSGHASLEDRMHSEGKFAIMSPKGAGPSDNKVKSDANRGAEEKKLIRLGALFSKLGVIVSHNLNADGLIVADTSVIPLGKSTSRLIDAIDSKDAKRIIDEEESFESELESVVSNVGRRA